METQQRVITRHYGSERGPLFICIGGIHGNEPAGVSAIQLVATLLQVEPTINPDFVFRGRLLGLTGNVQALGEGKRYISMDMNRAFLRDRVDVILQSDPAELEDEDYELYELISLIRSEIEDYAPDRIVILDIHSTSAKGGIFVIASADPESVRIGKALYAPVILDFAREVQGTTLGYFNSENFERDIVTVVFECGQHNEPLSTNRAIAAIINCMRTIGCVSEDAVENKHDLILKQYAQGLPTVARMIERFEIPKGHRFAMVREYQNFDRVFAGETLAFDGDTPVLAQHDGMILLPRLQDQGDDGFFIVQPLGPVYSEPTTI